MTHPKRLSDSLFVTPQFDPADMQALADAGFRSIMSNRRDGEDVGQPNWAKIEHATHDAGMDARHIPVTPGAITDDEVTKFATALEELPTPIVRSCRRGTRSASLWALSNADQHSPKELIAAAADAG